MYNFPNPDIYQTHLYQQPCQIFAEHSKNVNVLVSTFNTQFEAVIPQNGTVSLQPTAHEAPSELQSSELAIEKKKKVVINKSSVDTSSFSVEERLVAAVWVHERKQTKNSMSKIKKDFRQRFGRDAPAKNTLLVWERKLFSTGSVHDAPRPGRPVNRSYRMAEVAASVREAPALSLRARALALRLPRTTLRTILHSDLPHTLNTTKDTSQHNDTAGKQKIKRSSKRQLRKKQKSQVEV